MSLFGSDAWDCGRSCYFERWVLPGRIAAQIGDSFQKHPAVTDWTYTYFLQVFLREAREDLLVYLVLAECRLISFEAQAPQPTSDIHGGAPASLSTTLIETAPFRVAPSATAAAQRVG